MTTGSPSLDASLEQLADAAPPFDADEFSILAAVLKRVPPRVPTEVNATATLPQQTSRRAA